MRDQDATAYAGAIESAEQFGLRLYTEAWRRGWSKAQRKVVLGDGAVWICGMDLESGPATLSRID